LLAEIHRF
jgi:hypothetical protein